MIWMIIFSINISLLFVHEMDAVKNKEWKMFIVLKDLKESMAYAVFTLIHLPLYTILIFLLLRAQYQMCFYIVDGFLILHLLLHIFFERNPANGLRGKMSRVIIYAMGILSIIHIAAISI